MKTLKDIHRWPSLSIKIEKNNDIGEIYWANISITPLYDMVSMEKLKESAILMFAIVTPRRECKTNKWNPWKNTWETCNTDKCCLYIAGHEFEFFGTSCKRMAEDKTKLFFKGLRELQPSGEYWGDFKPQIIRIIGIADKKRDDEFIKKLKELFNLNSNYNLYIHRKKLPNGKAILIFERAIYTDNWDTLNKLELASQILEPIMPI